MNEWEVAKEFESGEIVASVRKRMGHAGRTQWSLMVGRKRPGEERLSPFVPVWVNRGQVEKFYEILQPLLEEAHAYVQAETEAEPAPPPRNFDNPPRPPPGGFGNSNGSPSSKDKRKRKRGGRRDDYGDSW